MRKLLLITVLLLSHVTFSKSIKEISLPDYWEFVSITKDSSILKGHSKIKILVIDKNNGAFLNKVQIFINTDLLIGQTDSNGIVNATFPFGNNKFCADTPNGNSFTADYNFLDQHYYVVKVRMNKYKPLTFIGDGGINVADKPVIYLYPEKKQKINVKVTPKTDFLFTYPKYPTTGWDVVAYPSGKIDYENRTYNYLFWEGTYPTIIEENIRTGFIVNSDTLIQFLENTLTTIGLNNLEQTDFITYWAPRLMENRLNLIHFHFNEDVEKHIAQLEIHPTPNSLIRIFMTAHGVDEKESILSQRIPSFKRKGYTVVEWGGSYH